MTAKDPTTDNSDKVKTCSSCGGIWPASRSHCLACGASLANVAPHLPAEKFSAEGFDWRWLDALAEDEDTGAGEPGESRKERSNRAWWQFWR